MPIPMQDKEKIAQNLSLVKEKIAIACKKSGRKEADVLLVAVSKYMTIEQIDILYELGVRDFAESYVQSLSNRYDYFKEYKDIKWHFIGHLQKNKVRKLFNIPIALIHSVDSVDLIRAISKRINDGVKCLLQVNFGLDNKEFGFRDLDELKRAIDVINQSRLIECQGLMCIAPNTDDIEVIRSCFAQARSWANILNLRELSMGMSNDYENAIEEGATIVRIGSALIS